MIRKFKKFTYLLLLMSFIIGPGFICGNLYAGSEHLFASQKYRSFFHSNNADSNMTVVENEYTLDQQDHGYRNFNKDANAGLYYLHARYYDPNTRQFLTKDPGLLHETFSKFSQSYTNSV